MRPAQSLLRPSGGARKPPLGLRSYAHTRRADGHEPSRPAFLGADTCQVAQRGHYSASHRGAAYLGHLAAYRASTASSRLADGRADILWLPAVQVRYQSPSLAHWKAAGQRVGEAQVVHTPGMPSRACIVFRVWSRLAIPSNTDVHSLSLLSYLRPMAELPQFNQRNPSACCHLLVVLDFYWTLLSKWAKVCLPQIYRSERRAAR